MNFDDIEWDRGCCAATAQFENGARVLLLTHTYADDDYRVEVYVDNVLESALHNLTRVQAGAALAAFA